MISPQFSCCFMTAGSQNHNERVYFFVIRLLSGVYLCKKKNETRQHDIFSQVSQSSVVKALLLVRSLMLRGSAKDNVVFEAQDGVRWHKDETRREEEPGRFSLTLTTCSAAERIRLTADLCVE